MNCPPVTAADRGRTQQRLCSGGIQRHFAAKDTTHVQLYPPCPVALPHQWGFVIETNVLLDLL